MSRRKLTETLKALSFEPEADEDWYLRAREGLSLLAQNARSDEVIIYASVMPYSLVHGVLAPAESLSPPDFDDLRRMSLFTDRSWIIEHASGGGEPDRVYLSDPMSDTGSKSLIGGEKLVFVRSLEGVPSYRRTIELNQKLVHSLGLYFLAERNAYCRLDGNGDVEEIIKISTLPLKGDFGEGSVVTVRADRLFEYMVLGRLNLVFKFDFTRNRSGSFTSWSDEGRGEERTETMDLHYGVGPSASFVNGVVIMRPPVAYDDIVARYVRRRSGEDREYARFKILDWRYGRKREIICSPDQMANYFTQQSGLPFAISPAFFRADVLAKYKADPEKYTIRDRTISCRNAWELRSFDINEAGQIFAYIKDLSYLPYSEQLYWQSFNEWPKAGLSKRAIENDFEGKWSTEINPLESLKGRVSDLDRAAPIWWKPRGDDLANVVHLPVSESSSEWADEILRLDQLVVEGFQTKPLRAALKSKEAAFDEPWGTIRLLQAILEAYGANADDARAAIEPLKTLHHLRSKLRGHAATGERRALEAAARSEHETFRVHFTHLVAGCDEALRRVMDTLMPDPFAL